MEANVITFERHAVETAMADPERVALLRSPAFGTVFTEHMVTVRYREGVGWYGARIEPFGPIPCPRPQLFFTTVRRFSRG
jgi:branched-chain amino acid aminotransferase